jgi:hypothetical protein
MPTKRRRTSRALREPLPTHLLCFFQTGSRPATVIPIRDFAMMRGPGPAMADRWADVRDEVIADWRRQGHTSPCWAEQQFDKPQGNQRESH